MERSKRDHFLLMAAFSLFPLVFMVASLPLCGTQERMAGLRAIWCCVNAFATDASAVGGLGSALFNAGLMGLFAWGMLLLARVPASGRSLGPFFLCMGAGMFGASMLTSLPIVLGGLFYAQVRQEPFSRSIPFALQSCALSPAVAALYFGGSGRYFGALGILMGILAGMAVGFCAMPLALHTRPLHQGFNLYGMGISLGVLGILLFSIYRDAVLVPENLAAGFASPMLAGEAKPLFFYLLFLGLFAAMFFLGLLSRRPGDPPYGALHAHPGLEVDFALLFGMPNVLINMSLTGCSLLFYLFVISAPFNGAAAGSLLYALCWTGGGAHPRNVFPILLGYCFISLLLHTPLNAPELVIGVCFATGLAPISGRFGGIYGILAGTLHAFIMPVVLGLNGGLNLHAGAFASGVVALTMYPLLHEISRRQHIRQGHAVRPDVTGELLYDAARIVAGMDDALSHMEAAEKEGRQAPHEILFLSLRNILACIAALLFSLSLLSFPGQILPGNYLRFSAYILGALAYGSEILVLTDLFHKRRPLREMFMPYIFGALYVALGFSYLFGY